MSSTTLLLVRHAHAEWVPDETRPLSEVGRRDAVRIARLLRPESPVAIYSSPYRRARESVEPLAASLGLSIEIMDDLRERSLGIGWDENFMETIRSTWEDFSLAYPDGGETNQEAMERAARALGILCDRHPDETIVVATHGNLLVLLLRVMDVAKGFEFWRNLTLPDVYRAVVIQGRLDLLQRLWVPTEAS
jgi:2,3-bisphosphoglycerate-dependent phosphoglycerate mutase